MSLATIADLNVDPAMVITPMVKKNLVDVVNEEFARQSTIYDAEAEVKKENILEQYKKGVGFDKLSQEYEKAKKDEETAKKKVEAVEKKLHLKGLTHEGYHYSPCY